jgi:hypothetical protein
MCTKGGSSRNQIPQQALFRQDFSSSQRNETQRFLMNSSILATPFLISSSSHA